MKKILSILLLLLIFVQICNLNAYSTQKFVQEQVTIISKLTDNGDSEVKDSIFILANNITNIEIWCAFFGKWRVKSFYLYITNSQVKYVDYHNKNKFYFIENISTKNKIINYINMFYIEKNEKIILKKIKREYCVATDYPFIRITGFKEKQKIFNTDTRIGNESYDVEYNPIFLEFYELLESLILSCK